jgi:hypothetical protein
MKARAGASLLMAGALLVAGLWISFHYTMAVWRLDSDTAIPFALWDGVRQHGLRFLASWRYTPDNWLLSLLPFTAVGLTLSGAAPLTTLVIGWLVFVASVGMTALLAFRLAGLRAAVAVAAILPFANPEALGGSGYLAHPISHNVSMAWILLTCLLAAAALRRTNSALAVGAGICVFICALSDPWGLAAIAAPLAAASGGLALSRRGAPEGRTAAALCAAVVFAGLAAHTHAFGLLGFLPKPNFAHGGMAGALNGAYWLSCAISRAYNIVPRADPDAAAIQIANLLALAVLLGPATWLCLRALARAPVERQLIVAVAILSLGAVTASYLLGSWDSRTDVGRFFPNLYFFAALLVVIGLAQAPQAWLRPFGAGIALYATLFVCAGAANQPMLWLKPVKPAGLEEAKALGGFLRANGLGHGYGPYWGAYALAMPAATEGAVTIRPVFLQNGRVEPRPVESSSLWYGPGDGPATGRQFLVIRNDGEECLSVPACIDIATKEFGPPSETLVFGETRIMVWPAPLRFDRR